MNKENPHNEEILSVQEFLEQTEAKRTADQFAHYFNNELGAARNLAEVIRLKLSADHITSGQPLTPDQCERLIAHLQFVHQIGNLCLDSLRKAETGET